jgi:mannosyl-oligosaccharide alpha-1,3-glucosidase
MPIRQRPRMTSSLMKFDPFTLKIALNKKGSAQGELYLDDGETYAHEKGEIVWRRFSAETSGKAIRISTEDLAAIKPSEAVDGVALKNVNAENSFARSISGVRVERIVVLGLSGKPARVKLEGGNEFKWSYRDGVSANGKTESTASILTIKDPKVLITKDWTIVVEL